MGGVSRRVEKINDGYCQAFIGLQPLHESYCSWEFKYVNLWYQSGVEGTLILKIDCYLWISVRANMPEQSNIFMLIGI